MTEDAALLSCCGLRKTFGKDAGLVRAVDGISRKLAAFHLDKLVDAGLLEAGFARPAGLRRAGRA
ncbi:MAG TPA: hypothetical protein VID31_03415 [Streptosporangiaceae bacterium]